MRVLFHQGCKQQCLGCVKSDLEDTPNLDVSGMQGFLGDFFSVLTIVVNKRGMIQLIKAQFQNDDELVPRRFP